MPILLTGAAGYLGRHVMDNLNQRCLPCVASSRDGSAGIPCNLTDAKAVRLLLDEARPSIIIHCAAQVPKTASSYDDAYAAESSVAMMKAIAATADCPVVFASSMTIYANATEFPVSEDTVYPPVAGYAYGKWLAEQILFERNYPGDVALRMPGLFGLPRRTGVLYNATRALLATGEFRLSAFAGLWAAMAVQDAAEYLVRAALKPMDCPPQAVNTGYDGVFNIPGVITEIACLCNLEWKPPLMKALPFSMCLERLNERYGLLPITFRQRLEELVKVVRNDLELERIGGQHA